jgi:glycine cleavage system transcriptional repressor
MMTHAILSAIGPDRPGLVEEVSQYIFQRGGNIEDSRMVNLRGQFAMMVLLGADEAAMRKLEGELTALEKSSGLRPELRPAGAARVGEGADARPFRLVATAMDQAGLVHRVSNLLRKFDVNIENLETRLAAAPYTGAPVFEMDMTLSIPRRTQLAELRGQLGGLCDQLNIDWQLTAV